MKKLTNLFLPALLASAAALGVTTIEPAPAEARRSMRAIVRYQSRAPFRYICEVRDSRGKEIETFVVRAKSKDQARFAADGAGKMTLHCGRSMDKLKKMRTKLDAADVANKGWSLDCDATGCRANVRSIRRA